MSLTQEQITQLEPLTQHPKYGKILSDAVEAWKREDVIPQVGIWGVQLIGENFQLRAKSAGKCCLLGAAIIKNNKYNQNPNNMESIYYREFDHLKNEYFISNIEIRSIMTGFDNCDYLTGLDLEAYKFGKNVSDILFE